MSASQIKTQVVTVFVLFLCCSKVLSLDEQQQQDLAKILDVCYELCTNGPACPSSCPGAFVGPWSKRKRAFVGNSGFNRMRRFDDYGWFMKLLGRMDKK